MSNAATIDEAGFRAALARDGYEAVDRSLPPGPPGTEHTHPFDARLLILEGAFTLARGGQSTTYRPGDIFEVPAGQPHAETPGPDGTRYIAGRRHKG